VREATFGRIRDAWLSTTDRLLEIGGEPRLLENDPALDDSIRLRLSQIEPLTCCRPSF
jgi:phosphoenolpyruvate carboxylase